jgi:hypothetical protein
MPDDPLDQMIEFAVAALASGDSARTGALVRSLAQDFSGEKALSVCFALTSAAAAIEDVMHHVGPGQPPTLGYKLAALVAADILAIEALNPRTAKAVDLLHFWRRVDPYFLQS